MTDKEKARVSRGRGRFVYVVFDKNGECYSHTARLLQHALDDARDCAGEIWLGGRCVVPAQNVGS